MSLRILRSCLFGFVIAFSAFPAGADTDLFSWFQAETISRVPLEKVLERMKTKVQSRIAQSGKVDQPLQKELTQIEKAFSPSFNQKQNKKFQRVFAEVGAKLVGPISLPEQQTPLWLLEKDRFRKYRSRAILPTEADYVIIGAGLTGTSTAYHLQKELKKARANQTIVILEAEFPASQSSGKNGGNFQLLPENYLGNTYDGIVEERIKWLKKLDPSQNITTLRGKAEQQALALLRVTSNNLSRFVDIIEREKISCDFSKAGWLRIASSQQEEEVLFRDTQWITANSNLKSEIWSKEEIQERVRLPVEFSGRFVSGSGNYHPYKFVTGVLKRILKKGNAELYTGVRVNQVTERADGRILLQTSEGPILAGTVIAATNAAASKLFPKMSFIKVVASQILNMTHLPNSLRGMTVTEKLGDIYYNMPISGQTGSEGMLHIGWDFFPKGPITPAFNTRSKAHQDRMLKMIYDRFPESRGQPPVRTWVGTMGFSPDRLPTIGFLRKKIIIAAGFNGYGGSYCIEAGHIAAQMAFTGENPSDFMAEIFSPHRFWR